MGALDGIRVIDIGVLVQAPQAAALLGDFGAEVIKVELPGIGDLSRWVLQRPGVHSGYWYASNRGKRAVTIDLRKPDGKEVFLKLLDTADVLLSNFKPGTLDEWGLGFEAVAARNPRLIYATGSTYGPIGPDATLEGADLAGQAAGGLISAIGADGDEPSPVAVTVADHMSSQHLAAGILAALYARVTTGRGQRIDASLVGGAIWGQASEFSAYFLNGELPGRADRGHPLINGTYGLIRAKDKHFALVGVVGPARQAFADAVGRPDLFADPRFAVPILTPESKQALFRLLDELCAVKTAAEWIVELRSIGVRAAPIRDYAEIAEDPQVFQNGYLQKVNHPNFGEITMVGSPLRMSDTPTTPSVYAPELGEHTEEVLLELGYDWESIAQLRSSGAV